MSEPIIFLVSFAAMIVVFLSVIKIRQMVAHKLLTRKIIYRFLIFLMGITGLLGIIITLILDCNYFQYQKAVPHKNYKSITLRDFKGFKRPYVSLYGESRFAFIATSISLKSQNDKLEVEAVFHSARSYVYNRKLYNEKLLMHEMYHFHITEYHARLLRKEIYEFNQAELNYDLDELLQNKWLDERQMQYQYDYETYHSYVNSKQLEWQSIIDSCLNSLRQFEKSIVYLGNN